MALYYLKSLSITPSLCIIKMHTAAKTPVKEKKAKYK
jgi:hypothetical protein